MRVTHVITRLIVGGAQENTIASVFGLRNKPGLDVSLISGPSTGPEGSLEPLFKDKPGLLRILPDLVRPVSPWHDLRALSGLTGIFRADSPAIVHTHSGKAGVIGRLAAARARVPVIIHTIHGPSFGPFQGPVSNFVFRAAEKWAARVTTHFIVVADAMRDQYVAAGIGRPDQFTKVLSGFDLDPFLGAKNDPALRSSLGIDPGDIVIGKIARLSPLKGHEHLLAIAPALAKTCPNIRFLLVGDGPLRSSFEQRARDLGVARHFVFAGLIPPGAVPKFVGIMDILTHLSRREGLPRALPQAMAAGKPVVAYDSDGAREVCIDTQTGFLLPLGEHELLLKRLSQLATDQPLRSRLGSNGRAFAASRFSVDQMVDSLHAIYLQLARK